MDRRVHYAADGTMKCDRTMSGYHMFHKQQRRVIGQYVGDPWYRCACGQDPRNVDAVKAMWKPGRRHEKELTEATDDE